MAVADIQIQPQVPASVSIEGLSFGYPGQGNQFTDISITVGATDVCCLLGPNGTGKTTLLRCLLGFLKPASGRIRLMGRDIAGMTPRELARLIAYLPQGMTTPFPISALDMAVMGRTPHLGFAQAPSPADRRAAREQLAFLGIEHLADRPFSLLSGGERQLTLLARSLVQEAPILVLDEPTAALDYGNEVRLLQIVADVARAGRTVLMTTHQPAHALSYASQAVLMRDGVIVADGPPGDVVNSARLSALYAVPVHVAPVSQPAGYDKPILTCVPLPMSNHEPARPPLQPTRMESGS